MPWQEFEDELAALINKYSLENVSSTPDYILARYLNQCLHAYESCKRSNDEWHFGNPPVGKIEEK